SEAASPGSARGRDRFGAGATIAQRRGRQQRARCVRFAVLAPRGRYLLTKFLLASERGVVVVHLLPRTERGGRPVGIRVEEQQPASVEDGCSERAMPRHARRVRQMTPKVKRARRGAPAVTHRTSSSRRPRSAATGARVPRGR